jgi:hypothetical protein
MSNRATLSKDLSSHKKNINYECSSESEELRNTSLNTDTNDDNNREKNRKKNRDKNIDIQTDMDEQYNDGDDRNNDENNKNKRVRDDDNNDENDDNKNEQSIMNNKNAQNEPAGLLNKSNESCKSCKSSCKSSCKPCNKEYQIHPECPLKLLKYTQFSSSGCISIFLALAGDLQVIVFKNIQYMVNRVLGFVIPRCICDESCQCYALTLDPNVVIDDVNIMSVGVGIIETQDRYYITIPITAAMISNCNLILYFMNLKINLSPVSSCTTVVADAWRWIPIVVSD